MYRMLSVLYWTYSLNKASIGFVVFMLYWRFFKRPFDIVLSALSLLVLLPLFPVIALAILLDSPGPVFYRATRVGRAGREFKLYKFRTMVANADRIGPGVTSAKDPRITRVGRFLRRTKLDELPQFINVLRGEMSIVGPRPEDPRYVTYYTGSQQRVLGVRPGITSPASVLYRHEHALLQEPDWERCYIQQIMPAKLAIDLDYIENPGFGRDIQVLWHTWLALWR
jgi:lipopolysaccharide/colanic/teichoic acid biosynthesis glycosyltransferase